MQRPGVLPLLNHVTKRLKDNLTLDALAKKARRSPFHLHREFREVVGETPKQYTERLRLERSASMLACDASASVLDVALAVGYESHEVFTRAFRRRFGMSPREYRARGLVGDGAAKHVALTRTVGPCIGLFHASQTTPRSPEMTYTVERTDLPEQPILFMRRKVKQTEVSSALMEILPRVYAHAQQKGIALAGPPFCRYAAWGPLLTLEAGMPVSARVDGEGPIESGTLKGGPAAKTTHAGAYDKLGEAHAALETWVDAEGVARAGAPWESYVTDPAENPDPGAWKTDIFLPLAR